METLQARTRGQGTLHKEEGGGVTAMTAEISMQALQASTPGQGSLRKGDGGLKSTLHRNLVQVPDKPCGSLYRNPIAALEKNETSGQYDFMGYSNFSSAERLQSEEENGVVYARVCHCAPPSEKAYYCPLAAGSYCSVFFLDTGHSSPGVQVSCYDSSHDEYLRYIFPLCLFLFIFLGIMCYHSPKGKYARKFTRRWILCWSEARYHQELELEVDAMALWTQRREMTMHRMFEQQSSGELQRVYIPSLSTPAGPTWVLFEMEIRRQLEGQRLQNLQRHQLAQMAQPQQQEQQQPVLLRTRGYEENQEGEDAIEMAPIQSTTVDNEIDVEVEDPTMATTFHEQCSICLVEFQKGDRVGDLTCGHVFHVACLKSWIQRRKSHCPLCKGCIVDTIPPPTAAAAAASMQPQSIQSNEPVLSTPTTATESTDQEQHE